MQRIVRFLAASAVLTVTAFIITGCCCGVPTIAGGPMDFSDITNHNAPVTARAEVAPR